MTVTVVIGLQWGDEGKGKAVDFLAERMDFVARFNGGNNAGILSSMSLERLKSISCLREYSQEFSGIDRRRCGD